jgi:hypothetical protein
MSLLAALALGAVLLASAGAKLARPAGTQAALGTYGLRGRMAAVAWRLLVAVELVLALAVAAQIDAAALAGAALLALFAAAQSVALARGRAGAPCACFGGRGRVGRSSVARAALLALALAALPLLPDDPLTAQGWLAVGLAVALLGVVGLAVAVLALAREVGTLRKHLVPTGALEIPQEGPELGGRSARAERLETAPAQRGLAVFTSEGCRLCHALAPAVAQIGRDPRVALRTFDEVRDADAWALADAPGSPFAVALDSQGTVLAKGTFNSPAQLESVLAAAERRRA